MGFFMTLLVGMAGGYLAGRWMKVTMPMWQLLIHGILGGALGAAVLEVVGYHSPTGLVSGVAVAFLGACFVIWLSQKVKR